MMKDYLNPPKTNLGGLIASMSLAGDIKLWPSHYAVCVVNFTPVSRSRDSADFQQDGP